jgi:hypothetical protein
MESARWHSGTGDTRFPFRTPRWCCGPMRRAPPGAGRLRPQPPRPAGRSHRLGMIARLPTIRPQPHDIPMDFIVTESGVAVVESGELRPLPIEAAVARARDLAQRRRDQEP